MGWREFVASLVDSLAWPAGIAIVAYLLRRQLAGLLAGPIKSLKAGPVELEYWETRAEVADALVQAELPEVPGSMELDEDIQQAQWLAEKVPVVAVGKAYGLVERRLREIATTNGLDELPAKMSVPMLAAALRQHGLISAESESAIRGLGVLRNMAAHDDGSGRAVMEKQARDYIQLVQGVLYALSRDPGGSR